MSHFNLSGERWAPAHTTVTWSVADQNFGGQPGGAFDDFIESLAVIADIAEAFSWWDEVSGLSFQMVPDDDDVDIRFGYDDIPGGATGLTTYSFDPSTGFFFPGITIRLEYSDFDPPPVPLVAHEIGHALGLDHFDEELAVMNSVVDLNALTGLRSSDIHGVQFLYGPEAAADPPENPELVIGDVLWQHTDRTVATFNHDLAGASNGWSIAGVGNFDGDADSDVLWRHTGGAVVTWELESGDFLTAHSIASAGTNWQIAGTGDFDRDNDSDILWRHTSGTVVTWEMEDNALVRTHSIASAGTAWSIAGIGDFDGDGDGDIVWRHQAGAVVTWEMEDNALVRTRSIASASSDWQIQDTGDFDADGDGDILWRRDDGAVTTWEMQNGELVTNHNIQTAGSSWSIEGAHDFDSDGDSDILWRDAGGTVVTWEMQNGQFLQTHNFGNVPVAWQVRGVGEFDLA
jgi:hypothetical protein